MNTTPTLSLDYADPPPPSDLLNRARRQGRAVQRRRRAGGAAAIAGVVIGQLAGPAGQAEIASPAGNQAAGAARVGDIDLSRLPMRSGKDSSIRLPEAADGNLDATPGSTPIVWETQDDGTAGMLWLSRTGMLCGGTGTSAKADPKPSFCTPLSDAPAEGLWKVVMTSNADLPPDSLTPINTVIAGIVRGPATRITVELPVSGVTDAHLVPAPDHLGTLFWAVNRDFTAAGTVSAPGTTPRPLSQKDPQSVTVYRDDGPVFHCKLPQCLGKTM